MSVVHRKGQREPKSAPATEAELSKAFERPAHPCNARGKVEVEQEILPQFLFRPEVVAGDDVAQRRQSVDLAHGAARVIASAMRMAAAKLAGEARPVPARSKAVP